MMALLPPLPDADTDLFLECFDQTVRHLHLPSKRKAGGYVSSFVMTGMRLAFGTVNRMRTIQLRSIEEAESTISKAAATLQVEPYSPPMISIQEALSQMVHHIFHESEESREVKNKLCLDGHITQTLDGILNSTSPDEMQAYLTALAHQAVDMSFAAQDPHNKEPYDGSNPQL